MFRTIDETIIRFYELSFLQSGIWIIPAKKKNPIDEAICNLKRSIERKTDLMRKKA